MVLLGLVGAGIVLFVLMLVRGALNGLSTMAVSRLAEEDDLPRAGGIGAYLKRREAYLLTLDLAITGATVVGALLMALYLSGIGAGYTAYLWTTAVTLVVVALLVTGADAIASIDPKAVFLHTLPALRCLVVLFGAVTIPIGKLFAGRVAAAKERHGQDDEDKEEEISALINVGTSEGILEGEDSELIRGVIEFGDTIVREVMTPRTDMLCVQAGDVLAETAKKLAKARHTRIPVYEGQVDNVVGVAYLKDFLSALLEGKGGDPVSAYVRPVPFVPENKPISALLRDFQREKIQIAIVVDEYGGVDGLVTTEDLIEEIVGEIQERHETEEEPFVESSPGVIEAIGRASVDDLSERLGVELPEGDYDSVAGWISTALGEIPAAGRSFELDGVIVKILAADRRRISRVRVNLPGAGG